VWCQYLVLTGCTRRAGTALDCWRRYSECSPCLRVTCDTRIILSVFRSSMCFYIVVLAGRTANQIM
jgi:hypothetical protein